MFSWYHLLNVTKDREYEAFEICCVNHDIMLLFYNAADR